MCIAIRDMDVVYEACFEGNNCEPDDIPRTSDPVWIFGKKYDAYSDIVNIRLDITSKLWFTYRRNFVPIGGDYGLSSDRGWGCMLRCGQMVLGQALLFLHLGREWTWHAETKDPTYLRILKKFEDSRQAPYSIHQIALTGVAEGKSIGQWFGPNTVAQVLKKLVTFDEWSNLAIHVALDNTVIISDIKDLCLPITENTTKLLKSEWKPLLLIVPLRLGLSEINPIYFDGLRKCFQFPYSLGVIGGKPNLALYFIGYVGNEVIYLDPHNTQRSGSIDSKESSDQIELDLTYHCKYASRMNISQMDPSIAVCFFCKNEAEFNDLCKLIQEQLILPEKQPLFEITVNKPKQWIPQNSTTIEAAEATSLLGEHGSETCLDTDSEFEIL